MKKLKEFISFFGVLLFLSLIAWLGWYLLGLFSSLQPVVQAAFITAIVGFTSLTCSNFYTSQREINLKLREKKVEVYSRFIEGWIKAFLKLAIKIKNGEDNYQDAASTELQEFSALLLDITDDLILWSSDDVLKKYCEFRENLPGEQSSEFEKQLGFINFCKFMLDIRKDLGHLNKGIDEYDLLSLFLETKAIDEYRKLKPDIDEFLGVKKN
jgi:hypothetical protein